MKLKFKLISGFLGFISLVAALGAVNIKTQQSFSDELNNIFQRVDAKLLSLENLRLASLKLTMESSDLALMPKQLSQKPAIDDKQELKQIQTDLEKYFQELESFRENSSFQQNFKPLEKAKLELGRTNQELIDLKDRGGSLENILSKKTDLEKAEAKFIEVIDAAIQSERESLAREKDRLGQNAANAILINSVFVTGVALLSSIIGFILAARIAKLIEKIKEATIKIGQGNFETRLEIKSNDELGNLADTFNQMVENLNKKTVSKSYIDNIFRSMIDALIILNTDGTIKTFNLATFLILRYEDEEELIGRSIEELFGDDNFLSELGSDREAQNSFLGRKETTLLAKDGTKIPVYFSASLMRDGSGQVQGFVCLAQDITERKQAEAARSESEAKWRSLVENAPDIIITVDAAGKIQFVNRVLTPGLSVAQAIGSSVYDYIPPESRQQVRDSLESVFTTGESQSYEIGYLESDGSISWHATRVGPIFNNREVVAVTMITTNISDRRRMEEALRESEERLEGILNSLNDMVWSVAADTYEPLYLNPATETVYGRSVTEFFGRPNLWFEVAHPEDRDRVVQVSHSLLKTGSQELEYRIVHPNGEVRWIHQRAKLTRAADGTPISIDGITTDITARKRSEEALLDANEDLEIRVQERTKALRQTNKRLQGEIAKRQRVAEALRQNKERLNGILNSLDDVVWSVSASAYELLYISPAAQKVYGYLTIEFFKNPQLWWQIVHPEDRDRVEEQLQNRSDTSTIDIEYRIVRISGEVRWLRDRSRLVCEADGTPIRIDGIATDITDRKRSQALRRASEERYRAIVEDQTELICRFLPDGTLTFVNDAYCRYFGLPRTELIGQSFVSAIAEKERAIVTKNYQSLSLENPVVTYEHPIVLSNGETRIQHWTDRAIFDGSGNLIEFQAVGRDITDRKRAVEALRQSEGRFRKLAKRESLINRLANQIRNSLDIDMILETAVVEIRSLLQIDRCSFFWYRPNGIATLDSGSSTPSLFSNPHTPGWEIVKESRNPDVPSLLGYYPNNSENSLMTRLLNREMVRADDLRTATDPEIQTLHSLWGYSAIAIVPIQTLAGEIGLLVCGHCNGPRPWRNSEVALLQAITDQLAIALFQAELYTHATEAAKAAKEHAQQLQEAMKALQQTQAQLIQTEKMSSLGQLVAGIAHEINNPLSFIYSNVQPALQYIQDLLNLLQLYQEQSPPNEIVQDEIEAIDLHFLAEDLPKLLLSMKNGAERISQIVLSLRNFSRLDEAQMKEVDIHSGLESTLLILQNRLKAKGSGPDIEVIEDYGELPPVECFANQLNQVFMNILNNAIDAIEESFTNISSKNKIRSDRRGQINIRTRLLDPHRVEIRIADNGQGISDQIAQRIFDPFFTTKPVGAGTGLGLSISYQIVVEKHKGQISCVSNIGQGAEFIIELPVRQQYAEPALFT